MEQFTRIKTALLKAYYDNFVFGETLVPAESEEEIQGYYNITKEAVGLVVSEGARLGLNLRVISLMRSWLNAYASFRQNNIATHSSSLGELLGKLRFFPCRARRRKEENGRELPMFVELYLSQLCGVEYKSKACLSGKGFIFIVLCNMSHWNGLKPERGCQRFVNRTTRSIRDCATTQR